jgi:pyruvate kinase
MMLSGESAGGDFPEESVETISKIASYTESNLNNEERFKMILSNTFGKKIVEESFKNKIDFIVNLDGDVKLTQEISSMRPKAFIIHCANEI